MKMFREIQMDMFPEQFKFRIFVDAKEMGQLIMGSVA